ncbi:MAG TPA: DUF4276 family protein [Bryobacteraceae bacterium]|jgi:hypothetical protein|nr:DUF4276 family protein [Bryobacteraceae bacterium]
MVPLYVACIVEGQGDFNAAPVLLKRLVKFVNQDVYADVRPFRVGRNKLALPGELERAVELAGRGLILIDSDDDCPKELAPRLLARATGTSSGRWTVGVVLAKSEFESWFIAAAESIAGHAGLWPDLRAPSDPESIRDAKRWLQEAMPPGRRYSPTVDQPSLAGKFDLSAARRAPSFDKLNRDVEEFCSLAIPV